MVEKWRHCLDNGGVSGALLTDLSKAFDHSVRWGINPLSPSKTPPSLFLPSQPLNLQTVQGSSPLYISFSLTSS